jgi:hypothetical protein
LSQARIGNRHGTTPGTIRRHAKAGGWVREVPTIPLRRGRRPRPPGTPKPTAEQLRNRKFVTRLLAALDMGLKQLEARMSLAALPGAAPASAADPERDARFLTNLTRLFQKLLALEEAARSTGKEEGAQRTEASEDADELRRDLALRIQRLNQVRDSQ